MSKKTYRVPADVKQQILRRLQTDNISVKQLADEHGISDATIYTWLKKKTTGTVSRGEHLKVVKENQHLKELLGQTMLDMSMDQKRG
jgi:transposase-like protein